MKLSAKSRVIINKNTERLVAECFALLRPPPRVTVSEFAEAERILSPETAAQSGRWRNIPYQIEMQDVFKDPHVNTAIFMTSTQCGKSSLILNILAYCIAHESGANTFMLPSESIARDFSKAQITPLIRDMPIVGNKIRGARKDGNTHLFKAWPGGSLRFVGSQRADKLASFPSPRLFIDELDRCVRATRNSAGQIEGSPVELLLERNKNWPNRFALLTSTPTIEGASAIAEWWEKSDKRKPHVPCPHCGFYQFLAWEQFEWEGKENEQVEDKPETIGFRCLSCKLLFTEGSRNSWLSKLKWVKDNPKSDIAGFHLNAFYSPWSKWSELLQKYLAAGSNAIKKMVWWNTTLGLPFSMDAMKAPDWVELYERPKSYPRYIIPKPAKILLAACDVQSDRLEVSVIAFYKQQSFVITHEVLSGNTTSADDECWSELDELLAKEWAHESGLKLRIHRLAIDAHYNTNTVANYARKRKQVVPITGVDNNWKTDLLPSRPLDIKKNGKYFRTGKRRWPIGVSLVKMDLYNRLKLKAIDGIAPSEYINFSRDLPPEYYRQLTGEVCKLSEDSRGQAKMIWEKQHEAVEALDCFVYTLALYKICGLHLWREERWL